MASPGFQQRVDRSADRAAVLEQLHRARSRNGECEAACAAAEGDIRAAQRRLDAVPAYERGWPVEVIVGLAAIAIVLEWYPARMMSLVFFFASRTELIALTAAFAATGFLLGLLLGELVRRLRRPQPQAAFDAVFIGLAAIAATGFLVVGYLLRFTYATASNDGSQVPNSPAIQAAALTMLAFTGIVLAFTSGYYRESFETLALRRRLGSLRGRLRTAQRHLDATRREVEISDRSVRLSLADDEPTIPTVGETVYGTGSASPNGAANGSVTRGG